MAICVLVWMGQTLNMLLWLHAVVSPRNVNKRQNCFFLSSYCVFFTIFLRMSSQKLCQNYLVTKSTFKAAQKLTSSQFCSKNALNEAIFPKMVVLENILLLCPFYQDFCTGHRFNFDGI